MNSDDLQSSKEKALTNEITRLKTETSQLENRNKELKPKLDSYLSNPTDKERPNFERNSQEFKNNSEKIYQNKQDLPHRETELKNLKDSRLKDVASKSKNDPTMQKAKGKVLEATDVKGENANTKTNQSIPTTQKEGYEGRQRGRVHPKDQARTEALRNRAKIPKQPNSQNTQQAKNKNSDKEPKSQEQQKLRVTKVVENANDNKVPNSKATQNAKHEAQKVRFHTKEQQPQKQPPQHANDNER